MAQFPNWDDEEVANLAVSTLEVLRDVRAKLGVKKEKNSVVLSFSFRSEDLQKNQSNSSKKV